MKSKSFLRLLLAFVILLFSGVQCAPSGKPTIDRFIMKYDIVAISDVYQAIDWEVHKASTIDFSVMDEDNNKVWSQSTSAGSSNGMQDIPVQNLTPGLYKVILDASNTLGHTTDTREFLLVGSEGFWYRFTKYVNGPTEGPWYGFNETVSVTNSQGLSNEKDVISVGEHVQFRHIRWSPDPFRWADREGCTSKGLDIMIIRQLTYSHTFEKFDEFNAGSTVYPFPIGEWNAIGQYHCSVDWSPCNFGWQGATRTYTQVVFFLEIEAFGN